MGLNSRYIDWMIIKPIEMELHPKNMNMEDGPPVSRSWKHLAI